MSDELTTFFEGRAGSLWQTRTEARASWDPVVDLATATVTRPRIHADRIEVVPGLEPSCEHGIPLKYRNHFFKGCMECADYTATQIADDMATTAADVASAKTTMT